MSIRNTMLYRRFWYVKKRYRGKVHTNNTLVLTIIIFFLFVKYIGNIFTPYIDEFTEYNVKSELNLVINEVVKKAFMEEIYYDDFVYIDKDSEGQIIAVTMNTARINTVSARLAYEIQNKINSIDKLSIRVPLGVLFGDTILYNMGPRIHIIVRQYGNIKTEFKSEFIGEGINQTKHRIVLSVEANIGVSAAFIKKRYSITTIIPFTETIIVGKVPNSYYMIE